MRVGYTCVILTCLLQAAWTMSIDISDPLAKDKIYEEVEKRVKRNGGVTLNDGTVCAQADIVFVVDSSGSIQLENWERVLNFTASMVESFPIGDLGARFGFVKYGNQAQIEFYLDDYNTKEEYLEHIHNIRWLDQATNTSGGIYRMYADVFQEDRGDRPLIPNIGIVITDGVSNEDQNLTIPRALEAKSLGITMFALGIGEELSMAELVGIASESYVDDDGNLVEFVFMATDFEALPSIRNQLRDAACEVTAECRVIADILFILDGSGSVDQANWDKMKQFISDLLDDLNIAQEETHVAMMTFSDAVEINFYLGDRTENRADVRAAINEIAYPRGTTRTFDALNAARTQVFSRSDNRPDVHDIIVLFTDGGSNDFTQTITAARDVRLSGITILVVGITMNVNQDELNEIATDPDESNVFMARNFSSLSEIRSNLKRAMCNDIDECAGSPCQNNGVCTDGMNTYYCQCTEGFAGVNCEIPCAREMDINIILDSSASLARDSFYKIQQFVKDLALTLPIDNEIHSSMGLASYSNDADVEFMMSEHRYKEEIVNAISLSWDRSGSTNTAGALDMMTNSMFTSAAGSRASKDDIAIVITDGRSVDREETFAAARRTREAGATVFAVGVGVTSYFDIREMNGIASDPDSETVFIAPDYDSLSDIIIPLVTAVCNEEDNCAGNPCVAGTCVDLVGDYRCDCPENRSGRNCERECGAELDLVLLVDMSGSIRRERFNDIIKPALKDILSSMELGTDKTRVGLATFSDDIQIEFQLNTYSQMEDVLQAVELLRFRAGRTNIADALNTLRNVMFTDQNGDRSNAPDICILLTDGTPTVKEEMTLPEAIQARVNGIHMILVAMEMKPTNLYLKGMASDPDSANIFTVDRYSEILDITSQISMATCDNVNECDSNPCQNGRCSNGLGQYVCICNTDFTGRDCSRRCTRSRDILFLLDASGSMEAVYDWQMQLTKEIVYGLSFDNSRTRVGLITYSSTPTTRFYLDEYFDRDSILNAISFLKENGRTGTADALQMAITDVLNPTRGDRVGVDNYVIVMTDGQSNVDEANTIPNAETLRNAGTRIMSVGVGNRYDLAELNGMASDPDSDNVFMVEQESEITTTAERILDEICQ